MVYKRHLFHSSPPVMNRALLSPRDEIYNKPTKRKRSRSTVFESIYESIIQLYIIIALIIVLIFHIYSIYIFYNGYGNNISMVNYEYNKPERYWMDSTPGIEPAP